MTIPYKARKIDYEALQQKVIKSYDIALSTRKRKDEGFLTIRNNSYLGHKTNVLDVPANTVWQKDLFDQTGLMYPIGNYTCPKCGLKKSGFPPAKCPVCGMPSPLEKINYRK